MGTRFRFLAGVVVPVLLLSSERVQHQQFIDSNGHRGFVRSHPGRLVGLGLHHRPDGRDTHREWQQRATGSVPAAMILAPSGTALFVANSGTNDISAYTVTSGRHSYACKRNHPDGWNDPIEHGHGCGRTFPLCS